VPYPSRVSGAENEQVQAFAGVDPERVKDVVSAVWDHKDEVAGAVGFVRDHVGNLGLAAARREQVAAELARAEQRFRTLVQHSSDLVLVLDRDGTIGYTTSAAESVVHHSPEQLVGRTVVELVHPGDRDALLDQLARVLVDPRPVHRELRAAGRDQWLELTARSLLDDPEVTGILVNVRDVTERRTFQDRLAHAASHDDLTGLLNRAELEPRLTDLVAAAAPGAGVALLYVDLDGFKEVNDRLGHAAGDAALVAVADRLTALLRPEDVVVRMGGDEFVAVLPRVPDPGAAEATVKRVRELLVQPVVLATGGQVRVGVSIGLVFLDRPDPDVERLVAAADAAMYHEKRDKQAARATDG
jgi:diguanylate cyclase (GGDEF)-like protein/PAS domain S-box-containing protein